MMESTVTIDDVRQGLASSRRAVKASLTLCALAQVGAYHFECGLDAPSMPAIIMNSKKAAGIKRTRRSVVRLVVAGGGLLAVRPRSVRAAELQVIRTYNVRDVVVTLLAEAGQWTTGENSFVVEFDSATQKRLIDVGAPTLTVTLTAAGNPSLRASALLRRGDIPGRYRGTITLPRAGEWLVTITWNGATSKGSATFPVSVQARGARQKESGNEMGYSRESTRGSDSVSLVDHPIHRPRRDFHLRPQ